MWWLIIFPHVLIEFYNVKQVISTFSRRNPKSTTRHMGLLLFSKLLMPSDVISAFITNCKWVWTPLLSIHWESNFGWGEYRKSPLTVSDLNDPSRWPLRPKFGSEQFNNLSDIKDRCQTQFCQTKNKNFMHFFVKNRWSRTEIEHYIELNALCTSLYWMKNNMGWNYKKKNWD